MGDSAKPNGPQKFDHKPTNKIKRQLVHVKRKQSKDSVSRAERFARKKEEKKNPKLREERLKKSVPLTLERKRVWDDVGSDVEGGGLGMSFDVERLKRLKIQEQEEEKERKRLEEQAKNDGADEDVNSSSEDDDDLDSMIASDSEEEGENKNEKAPDGAERGRKKKSIPTPTERATSPTPATRSTDMNFAPEVLAAKFPSLFNTDLPPKSPKILITTSIASTLHYEAQLFTEFFPNSVYIRRTAHRNAHKYSVREIAKFASNREYTALVVVEEDQKRVSGLTIVHLPIGPTFHFTISNWIEGKKLPGHGRPTEHWPELVLNNFRTPLGLLTAHMFRSMFPPQPDIEGRQVVTLHNQRDYIFVRRHRYVFRQKRETEKSVVGADGKEMQGVEGIRAGLQELGPRFTLKLRRVDKGIQRASGQEWEWKGGMEKQRTRFQL